MNRQKFFDYIRTTIFGGKLTKEEVDGLNQLLDTWYSSPDYAPLPVEYLAYCLATAEWETAGHMVPIAEYGRGKGRKYGIPDPETGKVYYGRGHVQLTWRGNYRKMAEELKEPKDKKTGLYTLESNPDLALNPVLSAKILYTGMIKGLFTGRSLKEFISPGLCDYVNARRIINGTDKALEIAAVAKQFERALKMALADTPPPKPVTPVPPPAPVPVSRWESILNWLRRLFGL